MGPGVGLGVGVIVGVGEGVALGLGVGLGVTVGEGVRLGVAVAVGGAVAVVVAVGVGTAVGGVGVSTQPASSAINNTASIMPNLRQTLLPTKVRPAIFLALPAYDGIRHAGHTDIDLHIMHTHDVGPAHNADHGGGRCALIALIRRQIQGIADERLAAGP